MIVTQWADAAVKNRLEQLRREVQAHEDERRRRIIALECQRAIAVYPVMRAFHDWFAS